MPTVPNGTAASTKPRTSWRSIVADVFGIDLRSLAALRIGLGLSVVIDTAVRAFDLTGLYTDAGVWPRELLRAEDGPAVVLSAHYWAGVDPGLQAALFLFTALSGLALSLGWRTRLANLACWYLVSSVQIRQPLSYIGGDSILRLMLFWSLFLPLGARFSLDSSQGRTEPRPDRLVSVATAAMLLQVGFVYWFTGLRKDGPLWQSGQAVFYTLNRNLYVTSWGVWLRQHPALLVPLSHATLALERFGPFLAFVPLHTGACRLLAIALFWGFHLGLASVLHIGLFPLFSMVAWLAFVPAGLWERLGSVTRYGPSAARDWRTRLSSGVALACLLYVVVLLSESSGLVRPVLPSPVVALGTALRLQQAWAMFAPDPATVATRYELETTRADGSMVPEPVSTSFRWILYIERIDTLRSRERRMVSLGRFAELRCGTGHDRNPVTRVALRGYDRSIRPSGAMPERARTLAIHQCTGH